MAGLLEGKVAIVTGGGRGIGRAEALLLAEQGAAVVVNDFGGSAGGEGSDSSPADEVVEAIRSKGGQAVANYGNVAEMATGEALVKTALDTFGRLDILVNNAGILRDRMVFNMSEEEWDIVIAVHLKGHFTTTKFASLVMRQQRSGRIVNTSSESGMGNMGQANYAAAKEGIAGLTRTCARDLGRYGVTVNCIRPQAASRLTVSPQMEEARRRSQAAGIRSDADEAITRIMAQLPEHVAPMVAYLCTDAADYINGQDFLVGGPRISLVTQPTFGNTIWNPKGFWTLDELVEVVPQTIGQGLKNQWPMQQPRS
jgi:3-oxoacyl-[acyl-carrier protein] reductase